MARIRGLTDWIGIALSARDPLRLAEFYRDLLGKPIDITDPAWITMQTGAHSYLAFMLDKHHEPPVWPTSPDAQGMQLHLDIGVCALEPAVEDALALGATRADHQPQEDVRVLLDPEGHPFCLYVDPD